MGRLGLIMVDESQEQAYPAEKARQGEIILKRRWQRIVFISGLVGFILLALIMGFAPYL